MKNLRLVLVFVSGLSVGSVMKAQINDPQTQYAEAVKSYVDAATEQMTAIRGSVDAQVTSISDTEQKKRFDVVFAKLDECDKLLVELKKSGQKNFDMVKAKFEKTRADAVKALERTNKA